MSVAVAVYSRVGMRRSDLVFTAHHEAGHWVTSDALFPSRVRAGIDVLKKDGRLGASTEEEVWWAEDPEADRQEFENEVVVLYAGHAAEVLLDSEIAQEHLPGSWDDDEKALDILELLESDEGSRSKLEMRLRKQAADIVERRWPAVQLLANALVSWERLHEDVCSLLAALAEDDPDLTRQNLLWLLHQHGYVSAGEDGSTLNLPPWLVERVSRRWPESSDTP